MNVNSNRELWDLASNFIFYEDDTGKNRADASVQKLHDLNNVVVVSSLTTSLTKKHVSSFEVVVFSNISLDKAAEIMTTVTATSLLSLLSGLMSGVFWLRLL